LLNKKAKVKQLSLFLKVIVFVATLYFIYIKVFKNDHFLQLLDNSTQLTIKSYVIFAIVVLLMPFNWILEAFKWQKLLINIEIIRLSTALKAVWAGLTINNWVPNRMAEFLGRMLFLKKENRNQSVSGTLTGGLAQFIVTLIIGIFSLVFIYPQLLPHWYFLLAGCVTLLLLIFYYNLNALNFITKKFRFFDKYTQVLHFYSLKQLSFILVLATLRYAVYLLQYFLILNIFCENISWYQGFAGVSVVFLVQALLPAVTITEIGTRGAAVLFVFQQFTHNSVALLLSAYTVWLINIIIPSLFGLWFFLKNKQE